MPKAIAYTTLSVSILIAGIFSIGLGAVPIPASEVFLLVLHKLGIYHMQQVNQQHDVIIFIVRFPRLILAILVGAALGISGAAIQGISVIH
nr:ABC-type Fe3+-siderophore transport system permease subunit [Mucilaginibacter sp. SP1R1]